MSHDVQELGKLINLPYPPKSATWLHAPLGKPGLGPTDYSLLAVLEYDDATCQEILRRSARKPEGDPAIVTEGEAGDWLPAEVRQQLQPEGKGYYRLPGSPHEPSLFSRSPLLAGYVVRIANTNELLVALSTT